ncbi:unnamed protein product, partial [Mesorhabditis spiculigera]
MHVLANRIGSHGKEVDYRKRGFFDGDDSGQDENLSTFLRNMTSDFRFIFMATDSSRMRKFLEEAVSDSFAHIIPRTLAEIYDELCVSLPYDLEEYSPDSGSNAGSVTHTPTKKDPFAEHSLYEGNRAAAKAMMDTFLDELASLSAPGDRKSNGGAKVGEKRRLSNDSKAEQPERKTVRKKTQRNRTGRAVKKSGKVYVSHILVNTYNHNKLRQNEPVCNIKGQIYFDKVESANLRWQHLVELKKRKLLNGKRQRNNQKKLIKPIRERSSDDSSTNGTTEATTNNQLLEPKREAITPDSDEEEL